MKTPELKPCPFCGGEAVFHEFIGFKKEVHYTVCCENEECDMSVTTPCSESRIAVAAIWNRRATDENDSVDLHGT